jgi:hypothetical protein
MERQQMEQAKFVAEGRLEVDPPGWFFVYLDGEYLGKRLVKHFQPSESRGHADLGRVRVTVERLDEGR